uniref:Uncharacterized protein n=1 Tax=Geladintestivirus 6 TaxID=3233138 RepID=A0AAU8MHV3_9CAUD
MKILGEKSLTTVYKIIKLFTICSADKNTIKQLTTQDCKTYHIECCFNSGNFYLCHRNWISSRKIVDILSQINQHCKDIKPYVQISCTNENPVIIAIFSEQKIKWSNSFKKIIIL